jgi:hypothetical protein
MLSDVLGRHGFKKRMKMAGRHKINLSRRAGPDRYHISFIIGRDRPFLKLHQYLALVLEFSLAKSMIQDNQNQVATLNVDGRYIKCRHTVPLPSN